jgi:signal peptidase II
MLLAGIAIAIVVAIVDQLAKWRLVDYFATHPEAMRHVTVTDFFNLVLTMNRGISFGMFGHDPLIGEAILIAVAAAIVIGLLLWLRRIVTLLPTVAIGMIIGGAVGNALDRVVRGAVVDFLDFHLGQWHPFAFNLADAAISVGVALLILDGLLGGRSRAAA